jgi:hypothetical protein
MAAKNHRLLVFTSDASKEASEGIAYQWSYLLENECKYRFLVFSKINTRLSSSYYGY